MTKTMHKYFGCSCMSLRHMISVIYFPPIEENSRKDEDDVIYLSITSENFRKNIIPQFWDKFFWEQLFDKDLKVNFYYGSIWKRFQIAYNYLVRNKEPQGGVLDCISLFSSYKEDILEFLSVFDDNKNKPNNSSFCELENEKFRLFIEPSKEEGMCCGDEENEFELLIFSFQLKKKKGFAKIWEGIKYIFKNYQDEFHFEITPEKAYHLKRIIQKSIEIHEKGDYEN